MNAEVAVDLVRAAARDIGDAFVETPGRHVVRKGQPHAVDARLQAGLGKTDVIRIREIVHVGDARRAAGQHLHRPPGRAGRHVLRRHLRLDREDRLLEPALQRKSAAHAAHERHRGMSVTVDEARHQELSGAVDTHGIRTSAALRRVGSRHPDLGNAAVLDQHVSLAGLMAGKDQRGILKNRLHGIPSVTDCTHLLRPRRS